MKTKLFFVMILSVFFVSLAFAEKAAEMDPAMMEKMKAATSPNENHEALKGFAGNWTYTAKFYMPGSTTPQESAGTSQSELIYGGRFVRDTVKGTWMGQPFEGTAYTGYDNVKGEYQSIWLDSSMTGIMVSSGQFDKVTKTLKMSGVASCPLTGEKNMSCHSETAWRDADHYTMTSYTKGSDGKEVKGMELSFTRA